MLNNVGFPVNKLLCVKARNSDFGIIQFGFTESPTCHRACSFPFIPFHKAMFSDMSKLWFSCIDSPTWSIKLSRSWLLFWLLPFLPCHSLLTVYSLQGRLWLPHTLSILIMDLMVLCRVYNVGDIFFKQSKPESFSRRISGLVVIKNCASSCFMAGYVF